MIDLCIKRDILIQKQKDNTMLIVFLSLEEDTLKDTLGKRFILVHGFKVSVSRQTFQNIRTFFKGTFLVTSFLQSGATSYMVHS